ncbi:MAG: LCP family protein [Synechococcaceae cyanobacterium RM1_1_27]|nr:LCP family protein [Synechococcaceae cyanobacterium SM2_3_2]NJO86405.1 LCP family protein [Synechococcaceae cyanobacterium RM1_1_27]
MASPSRPSHTRQSASRNGSRSWLMWMMVGFTAVTAGAAGALMAYLLPQPILATDPSVAGDNFFRANQAANLTQVLHILIMGADDFDTTGDGSEAPDLQLGTRTDTLVLARFDPEDRRVTLLSIPRDTQVTIPGYGIAKINSANVLGGPVLTAQMVSELVGGIPIDRYVRLNVNGLESLVDAMGGVEVFVPYPMIYQDVTQDLDINLEEGLQRLTGEEAHHFARFRQDELGDIGRVQRQQALIRALSREFLRPGTWTRIPQILQAIRDNLDTNLTWEELLSLSKFLMGSSSERLDMVLLPGRFSQPQEFATSYWIPDPQGTYQVAVNHFGALPTQGGVESPPPSRLRIAVQNATGEVGMARRFSQTLVGQGFGYVFPIVDDPRVLPTTQIIAQQGDSRSAYEMQALLGFGEVKVESTGALESDITVRVGRDWVDYWQHQPVPTGDPTS